MCAIQQAVILLMSALVMDGGLLYRQMVVGAVVAWFGITICALCLHLGKCDEESAHYFAKWCFVGISVLIFGSGEVLRILTSR